MHDEDVGHRNGCSCSDCEDAYGIGGRGLIAEIPLPGTPSNVFSEEGYDDLLEQGFSINRDLADGGDRHDLD